MSKNFNPETKSYDPEPKQTVHTYTISSEQYSRMMALYDPNGKKTTTELFNQLFDIGLWQLEYRREKNKVQAKENKILRRIKREHPELLAEYGK